MFIAVLRYSDPTATAPYRAAHIEFVRKHVESGHFLLSGPQKPRVGGVTIIRAASRAEAESIMAQEPYTIAGVANCEIVEFDEVMGSMCDLLN